MNNQSKTHGLSRRDFLKTAGILTVGAAVSSVFGSTAAAASPKIKSKRLISANSTINYAVIGIGQMGFAHLGILKDMEIDQNIKVVAICDLYGKRKKQGQARADLPENSTYGDYRRMLERKDIDVVVIATPEHSHARLAIDALDSGKHVYCEKPMSRYLDEGFAIRDAVKRNNRVLQVGSQACSDLVWQKAAEKVKLGQIGRLIWAQTSFCRNEPTGEYNYSIEPEANDHTVDWRMWLGDAPKHPWDPERFFRWRKYWDYSSGLIGDRWPHKISPLLLGMACTEFPSSVCCMGGNLCDTDKGYARRRDIQDMANVLVQFPSGTMVFMAASSSNEYGIEDLIRGQKANLLIGSGRLLLQPERPFSEDIEPDEITMDASGGTHQDHHLNLIHALRTGTEPSCNVDLALRSQVILAMAERSYREKRMVFYDNALRRIT